MKRWSLALLLFACSCVEPKDSKEGTDSGSAQSESASHKEATTESSSTEESETELSPGTDEATDGSTGTHEPGEQCYVTEQNCPEDQKCTLFGHFDEQGCVPLADEVKKAFEECEYLEGEPFAGGIDNCEKGTMCRRLAHSEQRFCIPFCNAIDETCWGTIEVESECVGGRAQSAQNYCLQLCDPTGESEVAGCVFESSACASWGDNNYFTCSHVDPDESRAKLGEVCESDVVSDDEGRLVGPVCGEGLQCARNADDACPDDTSCCTPVCKVDEPDCPDPNQICSPWAEDLAVDWQQNIGVCTLPK